MIPTPWPPPSGGGTTGLPAELLAEDARLLESTVADGEPRMRWYRASAPAVVGGLAQYRQLGVLLDDARCARAGVSVHARASGGGLVFWDEGLLCLSIAIPARHPLARGDVTEAYAWLGASLLEGLTLLGVADCRMLPVAEAPERWNPTRPLPPEAGGGHSSSGGTTPRPPGSRTRGSRQLSSPTAGEVSRALAASCYARVSPYEIVVAGAKMVGLAQCRRKGGTLFQAGILLRNQARLADFLRMSRQSDREVVRAGLATATRGLFEVLGDDIDLAAVVNVVVGPIEGRLWPIGRLACG